MKNNLLKYFAQFSGLTFISRISGLVRDLVFAAVFGTSLQFEVFLVAFRIPNFMRRLLGEGAFSQAFVPVLAEYKTNKDQDQIKNFLGNTFGNLLFVLFILTVIGIIFSGGLFDVIAPGLSAKTPEGMQVTALSLTMPFLLFVCISAFFSGVLNSYQKFALPAFVPVLLNFSLIIGAFLGAKFLNVPAYGLCVAVSIAGLLQAFLLGMNLRANNILPRPSINFKDPGVNKVLSLLLPAALAASVHQVNILADTFFASQLMQGSLSWLYYADRLMEFPLGMFGVALSTVVLPTLSSDYCSKSHNGYTETLSWGLRLVLILGIPCAFGLSSVPYGIMTTLFGRGNFQTTDALNSSYALMAYAPAIVAIMLTKVLSSAHYARQDMRTPIKVAVVCVITNIVFDIILMNTSLKHAGLALATSIASVVNASLLFISLYRKGLINNLFGWGMFLSKVIFASSCLFFVASYMNHTVSDWAVYSTFGKVTQLFSIISVSGLVYVLALLLLGLRPQMFLVRQIAD